MSVLLFCSLVDEAEVDASLAFELDEPVQEDLIPFIGKVALAALVANGGTEVIRVSWIC